MLKEKKRRHIKCTEKTLKSSKNTMFLLFFVCIVIKKKNSIQTL